MLELKHIKKSYIVGGIETKALDDISIAFREKEFVAILGMSGSGKTTCLNMIGGLDRYDRGNLLTVLSFLPYEGSKGFCVDVMHRKTDAMTGVMEHAIIAAVMKLKEEGVTKLSLGIAPLAGIDTTKPGTHRAEKLMNAIFHNMNSGYNFKNLHRFKKKFDPTIWKPRYLVYHRDISLVNLAVSITNTKRGSADIILYAKYKFFLIAVTLGLYKIENK